MTVVVPDFIEPLVGWRVWLAEMGYSDDGRVALHLSSLYYRLHWPQGRAAEARCEHVGAAPCHDVDHLCGVHAARTLELAARYLPSRVRTPHEWALRTTQVLIGRVSLWGDVMEHDDGWRAQYAYPHTIYVPTFFKARGHNVYADDARELLARGYGVKVRLFRRWEDTAPAQRVAA